MTDTPASKTCSTCREEKPVGDFNKSNTKSGFEPRCKGCRKKARSRDSEKIKARSREYYLANRERLLNKQAKYYEENRETIRAHQRAWCADNQEYLMGYRQERYSLHREEIKAKAREYYHSNAGYRKAYRRKYVRENREKARQSDRASYEKNRERRLEVSRQWAKDNQDYLREWRREYRNRRYLEDPNYRLRLRMKGLLSRAAKSAGVEKGRTVETLGYPASKLKARMEAQFKPGMSWDNYGEWHIDHKIPVSWFLRRGEKRLHIINALCNLQPLWAEDNFKKNDKWAG